MLRVETMKAPQPHKLPVSIVTRKFVPASLTLISCSLLVSCGGFSTSNIAQKSVKSIAKILPSRMPVAEVRQKDLQEMPIGADRALAWDRRLDGLRYASTSRFFAPKNYQPPRLPDERTIPADGGILPPLHPGRGSSLNGRGNAPLD